MLSMHRIWPLVALGGSLLLIPRGNAAETTKPAPEKVNLTGKGLCARNHHLGSNRCATALEVSKDGKTQIYLLDDNDVSKKFHPQICVIPRPIKVTGTVRKPDAVVREGKILEGKLLITASKIE